ncbi:MAG: hypothetical protein Q8L98_00475 [Chlamydiales bacterium]|nr:hypothetical protein [Chlamydiales bacterium]
MSAQINSLDQASKSIQNFLQECRAGCIIDVSSIIRNSEALRETLSNGGSLLHYAGTFSRPFTVFAAGSAALMAVQASLLVAREVLAKDKDMHTFALRTFLILPEFVNYFLLGASLTTLKVATLAGSTFVAQAASVLLTQSALMMGVCYLGLAAHGIHETELLSSELGDDENAKEVVKDLALRLQQQKEITEDQQKTVLNIHWREGITESENEALFALLCEKGITESENEALVALLGRDEITEEEKNVLITLLQREEQLADEKNALIARLERQTNPECVKKLLELNLNGNFAQFELELLTEKFEEPNDKKKNNQTNAKRLKKLLEPDLNGKSAQLELEFLAQEIREANYKAKINQRILLILGLITLLSTIVANVSTGGVASLCYIGGATLWLSQDSSVLSKQLGDWFWQQNQGTSGLTGKEFWAITAAGAMTSPLWVIPALLYFECTQSSDE